MTQLNLCAKSISIAVLAIGILAPMEHVHAAATYGLEEKYAAIAPHHTSSPFANTHTLLSPKAQQIEYMCFLAIIGLSIVIPEIAYVEQVEQLQSKSSITVIQTRESLERVG